MLFKKIKNHGFILPAILIFLSLLGALVSLYRSHSTHLHSRPLGRRQGHELEGAVPPSCSVWVPSGSASPPARLCLPGAHSQGVRHDQ